MGRVTIRDIAERAGTSFKTVSRVINGQQGVSEGVRERVRAAMDELDYRPDRAAQTLRSGRNYTLCILTPTFERSAESDGVPDFISTVLSGALRACEEHGYRLAFAAMPVEEKARDREHILERLRNLACDGVILFPPHSDQGWLLDRLDEQSIPYARLVPGEFFERSACFLVDDFAAGRQVGQLLLANGHRNIACIAGPDGHVAASRRALGFRAALEGSADVRLRIDKGSFLFNSGLEFGRRILAGEDSPSAVFAANDMMALGVMAAAGELGIAIPDELSVVGFDDIPTARFVRPALTTVAQPVEQMADQAARLLIEAANAKRPVENRIWQMPFRVSMRESVAQRNEPHG